MTRTKPLKRSRELVPLSREHHDGLLLCWKIRTGLSKGINADRIAEYVLSFYKTSLKPHFKKEEDFLFILLPASDTLREQAEEQHRQLENYILDFKAKYDYLKTLLNGFANLLEQHIRFEERNLFPWIEQRTEPQILESAGLNIEGNRETQSEAEWDDKFWLK